MPKLIATTKKIENVPTITTKITRYYFDVSDTDQAVTYEKLRKTLKTQGLECFTSHGGASHFPSWMVDPSQSIELETGHIFNNQWNGNGHRVFDWCEDYVPSHMNQRIKKGHYLAQVPEMESIRNHVACGYCGAYSIAENEGHFCKSCIDSQYLKKDDLKLLRLRKVSDGRGNFLELSKEDEAFLMPIFTKAKIYGVNKRGKKRIAEKKRSLKSQARKRIKNARIERDGMLWLIKQGISLENVIYYAHTGVFSFGWRHGLSDEESTALQSCMDAFSFPWEIKLSSGKTLEWY